MNKDNVKTLQDLITESAARYGEKTYLKEVIKREVVETSFAKLLENSKRICTFENKVSNGKKFHAAVIGVTSSAYLTAYFGTVCNGNVIIPLDAKLSCEDLCDHLNRSDSEMFFFDKKYIEMLPEIKKNCSTVKIFICLQDTDKDDVFSISKILADNEPCSVLPEIDPASCAAILYTSGTTGKSKGVMLSHSNLIDNTMCQDNESSTEDVILSILPIHHVYCFTCDILLSLRYGTTVCVNDSMMHIPQNLKRFEPTVILIVPMIAETIYKKIQAAAAATPNVPITAIAKAVFGPNIRGIYSGGAYLNPELADAYEKLGIPIAQGYGMTECSPRMSTGDLTNPSKDNVGPIVNGCSIKIVDGEIWAKSPSVMIGYYKDPAATAESLTEDGWLKTGDLGFVDENNCIHITGRKKNLIILSNGENVSPEELENKFAGLDWLSEVLVYAEDETICAELFPNSEYCAKMSAEEIQNLCREHIDKINKTVSGSKAIHRIRIRDTEFDKTTSNKIKRKQTSQGELLK